MSESWSQRKAILSSGVNLFCWKRPKDTGITQYLIQLTSNDLANIRANLSLSTFESDFSSVRSLWDPLFDTHANAFWKDVAHLAKDFLHMSASATGTLHLRLVNDDACTKFHLDGYDLRLFTTYLGPGTEWLPEAAVNRAGLGKSNTLIVRSTELIERMQPFEVAILKGEVPNMANDTLGIVHRSPAIAELGQKRIIMRLDI